jgi:nitrile hydratase beta subunit
MDGIHDLGGTDGFGPVPAVGDEETFHERWEGRTHAMLVGLLCRGAFNTDEFRHARERVDPRYYLEASYYELVLTGIEKLLVENGTVDAEELERRAAAASGSLPSRTDEELVDSVREFVHQASPQDVSEREPAFEPGDRVVARNDHPPGHTRLPGYVRRATGTVERHYGTYRLPDANAHGESAAHPVYNVRFDAEELWGEEWTEADAVRLDLWEPYLENP